MTQVYYLLRDDDVRDDYDLRGMYPRSLPLINCRRCRRWLGFGGVRYPSVRLKHPVPKPLDVFGPVDGDAFATFRDEVLKQAPQLKNCPIVPGTKFGTFEGYVDGYYHDLVVFGGHYFFMRQEACQRLTDSGVRLPPTVPTRIQGASRRKTGNLLDIELPCLLKFVDDSVRDKKPCEHCGVPWMPKKFVAKKRSIPKSLDLFTALGFNAPICTERFVKAVEELDLTGAVFKKVAVQ